jgi:hydrogenase/urease accessory protein HupE
MIANLVYSLCALTALTCAGLLWRGYARTKARLLLWSSICFIGLSINNIILVVDKIFVPDVDLYMVRLVTGLVGLLFLVYGLVWDTK